MEEDLPLLYKELEFRIMINKELYDEHIIDLKTFNMMEERLIARLTKIKNNFKREDL